MNLESPKVTVEKSAEYIFNALTDIKNFEKLMPENLYVVALVIIAKALSFLTAIANNPSMALIC